MRQAGLLVACGVAAIVVTAAAVLRLAGPAPDAAPLPDRVVLVLIATALLLAALLAGPRVPGFAWATATLAAALGAIEVVAAVRSLEALTSGSASRDLSTIAGAALVAGAWIAGAYAARGWRTETALVRAWIFLVALGGAATLAAVIWAIAQGGTPVDPAQLSPLRIAARIGLATMAGGLVVGAGRDLGPRVRRAYERTRGQGPNAGGPLWRFAAGLADELVPGQVAGKRVAVESERARLAADLHALALPGLRRAAATAEAAGLPPAVQVDLRRALEDVEQLMHERQSIVLEQFGLVAAIEWLAERTEERSPMRVELELDGDVPARPDALDPTVARAMFRIALLALDNVARHAGATAATVRLSAETRIVRLLVLDDGSGAAAGDRGNGRGIADMRSAAAASGGTIDIQFEPQVRVEAVWRRAR